MTPVTLKYKFLNLITIAINQDIKGNIHAGVVATPFEKDYLLIFSSFLYILKLCNLYPRNLQYLNYLKINIVSSVFQSSLKHVSQIIIPPFRRRGVCSFTFACLSVCP